MSRLNNIIIISIQKHKKISVGWGSLTVMISIIEKYVTLKLCLKLLSKSILFELFIR